MLKAPGKNWFIPLLLVIAGAIMFLPFLGRAHLFDWDEINFAECAREMIMTKKYFLVTINYLPFWEKPPLFIWMQALSMNLFGVGDYAARLPNAICGIVTLLLLYKIGTVWKDWRFGLIWVLAYVGSMLPYFYFKSGIIDPWFNFFIFSGIYFFARYRMVQKNMVMGSGVKSVILSALCIGLAVMTKGPVAFLVFSIAATVYWALSKGKSIIKFGHILLYLLVLAAAGGIWFIAEALTGHWNTVQEFISYQIRLFKTQDAGHGGPLYFHFIILLVGCFPASILAIRGLLLKKDADEKFNEATRWMGILFWVVLVLFTIVKTKIVHYSSLCYYPLTFFAAWAIYRLLFENDTWKKWMSWGIGIMGGLIAVVLTAVPIAAMNKQAVLDSGIIHDEFIKDSLQTDLHWNYGYCMIGIFLLGTIIFSLVAINRKMLKQASLGLFLGTLITTNAALFFIMPRIEQYSQQAAIEFCQGLAGKDVYITTIDYKSFAHYFYANMQPCKDIRSTDDEWLLSGNIDKPAYFICKINDLEDLKKKAPDLKELYRKNGFIFFERDASSR